MMRKVQISGQQFELDSRAIARAAANTLPDPIQEHFVVIDGRRFPPKQVIALATGLDRADFTSHQARRILKGLGFTAARRGALPRPGTQRSAAPSSEPLVVASLRPHIGDWVAVRDDEVIAAAATAPEVLAWLSRHDQSADSVFRVPDSDAAAGGAAPA